MNPTDHQPPSGAATPSGDPARWIIERMPRSASWTDTEITGALEAANAGLNRAIESACRAAVEEACKPLVSAIERLILRYQTVVNDETESGAWKQATDAIRAHQSPQQKGGGS